MKYIRVEMPDFSKWDIPADFVAKARAKYYADKESTNNFKTWNKVYSEEYKYTMEDDYELTDWLACNMNWKDVKGIAIKVEDNILTEEQLQEGICNGKKEIIEK